MSAPDSIVAAQLEDLLGRLEADRQRRCAAELESARERARALTRAARTEARRKMHEAVRYERTRLADSIALRRAELEAARRQKQHAAMSELVRRTLEGLAAALERRWSELSTRGEWCEAALVAAAQRLRAADWVIEIAPGSSREERGGLLQRAAALRPGKHTLEERKELAAGLRLRAAGATLDASVAGLLDDPAAIGGRILHEWLRESRAEPAVRT